MASQRPLIDVEWAEALIGLRVKVPDHWWVGFNSRSINDGKISSFDPTQQKWMLVVDSEPDAEYPIAYEAIYSYADEGASTFEDFVNKLYGEPVRCGDDEFVVGNNRQKFSKTNKEDWSRVDDPASGRVIEPLPWTGKEDEEFSVKATDEELESFKDSRGEIQFEKVFRWALPRFGEDTLFEWQAARMRNYMTKLIKEEDYKPRFYKPDKGKVITGDHVARFYGCLLAKMLAGNPSDRQAFSSREVFNAVEPIKNSMTLNAVQDLKRCLHFSDDWEDDDDDWDEEYTDCKIEAPDGTAQHRKKFSMLEDAYNRRWQSIVTFGKWLTADESRVAGWYHLVITEGPLPKPCRTGATLHSLCVTEGPLRTYKLFVRAFGGKTDMDMNKQHPNLTELGKSVTLYSIMLKPFFGRGHCLVMDSAYMGDSMALIGRHIWKINMVGTVQTKRTAGGDVYCDDLQEKRTMKLQIGSYDSRFYQHATEPLTYAVWSDNNYVKTLSNFHSPTIAVGGLQRRRYNLATKKRDIRQSAVDCPEQMKDYCNTYHWIDKGNANEAKFALGGESHQHGWTPKIAARLFNMNLNNAYRIYCSLLDSENYEPTALRSCVGSLALSLLHQGEPVRKREAGLTPTREAFGSPIGRNAQSDAK